MAKMSGPKISASSSFEQSDHFKNLEEIGTIVDGDLVQAQRLELSVKEAAHYFDTKQKHENLFRQKVTYWWILATVTIWLFMIIAVVFLIGFGWMKNLSDGAVITLFATTTANVIGMLWLVIKYLFKSN